MIKTEELYDLNYTLAGKFLNAFEYPWQALPGLGGMISELGKTLGEQYSQPRPQVWVHRDAAVAPTAWLGAPCIIGAGTQIRHCAFIRGGALIVDGCVIGNSVEIKNAILFDGAQVPHFNYVGDSILGYKCHLGAGSIISNFKSDGTDVVIRSGDTRIATGLRKCGAMVGDYVEIGCNSVLNPGTVIGPHTTVYPSSCIRGVLPGGHILKTGNVLIKKEGR